MRKQTASFSQVSMRETQVHRPPEPSPAAVQAAQPRCRKKMQRSLALRLQPAAQAHGAAAADEILSPSRRQPRSKFKPCCVSPGLVGVDSYRQQIPRRAPAAGRDHEPPTQTTTTDAQPTGAASESLTRIDNGRERDWRSRSSPRNASRGLRRLANPAARRVRCTAPPAAS